jgi:hypothetical protein
MSRPDAPEPSATTHAPTIADCEGCPFLVRGSPWYLRSLARLHELVSGHGVWVGHNPRMVTEEDD